MREADDHGSKRRQVSRILRHRFLGPAHQLREFAGRPETNCASPNFSSHYLDPFLAQRLAGGLMRELPLSRLVGSRRSIWRVIATCITAMLLAILAWGDAALAQSNWCPPGARQVPHCNGVVCGYMCQCPDGSYASLGVPCKRAVAPAKKDTAKSKPVNQVYCGTGANNLSYFCPDGTTCGPGNIKSCEGVDGKTRAALERRLTASQRQAAESQKKGADLAAEKIKAERAKMAPIAAARIDTAADKTAKLAVAAGLVSLRPKIR